MLAASDQLSLTARSSTSTAQPLVAYKWSQVSGTPLRIGTPEAVQTTVSWGDAPPAGVEQAVVRLTVTDALGDTETTDAILLSASVTGSSHVLYLRSTPGDGIGSGATTLIEDSAAQFQEALNGGTVHISVVRPGYAEWWYLDLAVASGTPFQVGAYDDAIRAAFAGSTRNGVDLSGSGRGCNQVFGRFDVLEVATDSSGAITRLAVDFEQHCEFANAAPLLGSYRVNSSVPIRR